MSVSKRSEKIRLDWIDDQIKQIREYDRQKSGEENLS